MNNLLKEFCDQFSYTYFNPYGRYKRADGCLDYSLSDHCLHIGDNSHFLDEFYKIVDKIWFVINEVERETGVERLQDEEEVRDDSDTDPVSAVWVDSRMSKGRTV